MFKQLLTCVVWARGASTKFTYCLLISATVEAGHFKFGLHVLFRSSILSGTSKAELALA